jgi:hypothetical protein
MADLFASETGLLDAAEWNGRESPSSRRRQLGDAPMAPNRIQNARVIGSSLRPAIALSSIVASASMRSYDFDCQLD